MEQIELTKLEHSNLFKEGHRFRLFETGEEKYLADTNSLGTMYGNWANKKEDRYFVNVFPYSLVGALSALNLSNKTMEENIIEKLEEKLSKMKDEIIESLTPRGNRKYD